jgi:tRNA1Val (adenine37-N6)-methyltransferase
MLRDDKSESDVTRDAIYGGRLVLEQPRDGYRFSVDALLLTGFASRGEVSSRALDLGAGCGIIGIGLLAAGATGEVKAIELQPRLAALARINGRLNGLEASFEAVEGDIRDVVGAPEEPAYDLVVSNPPFWPAGSGRMPRSEERRIACHETTCGIDEWMDVAARAVHQRRGRVCVVYPARRFDSLVLALERVRLSCTRARFVHPNPTEKAELVLVEARHGGSGRGTVEPPLVLKDEGGADTPEAREITEGRFTRRLTGIRDRRTARG